MFLLDLSLFPVAQLGIEGNVLPDGRFQTANGDIIGMTSADAEAVAGDGKVNIRWSYVWWSYVWWSYVWWSYVWWSYVWWCRWFALCLIR
jgi:hypothetical protein